MSYKKKTEEFLTIAKKFHLGGLVTESPHQETVPLSTWAENDLESALATIKEIDLSLVDVLSEKTDQLLSLAESVRKTLKNNNKIIMCGCGATGRLSLVLETLWKSERPHDPLYSQVESFMAGGDVALIQSIENFEDFPHYGEKQLLEMGFKDGDLLIATTEGGETPFVIGATEAAAKISKQAPYFLYCNPDDILSSTVERSRKVIDNNEIKKINLTVGPMVLAGSTRMQASTILMFAVGLALNFYERPEGIKEYVVKFKKSLNEINFNFLIPFIERESLIYKNRESLFYSADEDLGISILTDTTERSPTFSLHSFENIHEEINGHSLCYLMFKDISDVKEAWNKLLQRPPRALTWEETKHRTGLHRLWGFDISNRMEGFRLEKIQGDHHYFEISNMVAGIEFKLDDEQFLIKVDTDDLLFRHLILKILLNTHSTLVMGRLGRYVENIMTWVRPSNNKLIDRSIRYSSHLLERQGKSYSYEEVALETFKQMEGLSRDEAIVLKVFDALS